MFYFLRPMGVGLVLCYFPWTELDRCLCKKKKRKSDSFLLFLFSSWFLSYISSVYLRLNPYENRKKFRAINDSGLDSQ